MRTSDLEWIRLDEGMHSQRAAVKVIFVVDIVVVVVVVVVVVKASECLLPPQIYLASLNYENKMAHASEAPKINNLAVDCSISLTLVHHFN